MLAAELCYYIEYNSSHSIRQSDGGVSWGYVIRLRKKYKDWKVFARDRAGCLGTKAAAPWTNEYSDAEANQ